MDKVWSRSREYYLHGIYLDSHRGIVVALEDVKTRKCLVAGWEECEFEDRTLRPPTVI